MRKRVLITGVAGFIGSNLATMLIEKGHEILGIDNLSSGTFENIDPRVKFFETDIRQQFIQPIFKDIDVVFHLAAKNCLNDCHNHPIETAEINVQGTLNVLECARAERVKKFIYADTSAEYEGVTEFPSRTNQTAPRSVYATSKAGGASFCQAYARWFGLNVTILRYFNVYGPAQDWRRVVPPVMSSFIMKMLKGERPLIYGTGEKKRDFIYVDDVNRFHLLVMNEQHPSGGIFNVGSGTNYSIREIFEMLEKILKTGLAPIYEKDLPSEAELTLADITESKKLGWTPRISIEEGLQKSIAYIQNKVFHESSTPRRG